MPFSDIIKRVAKKINQWDETNSVFVDGFVTLDDVKLWINDKRTNMYTALANTYPQDFTREATSNNYAASTTVSASSTSTTLITSSPLFDNSMVGETVYNSTDSDSAVITAYTSSTQVTLDTTIGDTWDGDTVMVLNGRLPILAGDLSDKFVIDYVGVKFDSTDDSYTRAEHTHYNEEFVNGWEMQSELQPKWYTNRQFMYILPKPEAPVTRAVYTRYLELPTTLSADGDTPSELPYAFHDAIYMGALADAWDKKGDDKKADRWMAKFAARVAQCKQEYRPFSRDTGFYVKSYRRKIFRERPIERS